MRAHAKLCLRAAAALFAGSAFVWAGCASPPQTSQAEGEPLGPQDPFAVRSAALLWPGAASAILATDSSLRVSAGAYAIEWRGRCANEDMPVGRFGRPKPSSPNVVWMAQSQQAVWRMELAPVPVQVADESHLLASIEVTVTPRSEALTDVEFVATLVPDSAFPVPSHGDPDREVATPSLKWRPGKAGAQVAVGPSRSEGSVLRLSAKASHARPARWRFLFAGSPLAGRRLVTTSRTAHAGCMADAERAWARMFEPAVRLHVGDATIEQAVNEALFVLVGCTERTGGHVRPIGNPFQYRDTWLRDAARQVSALAQWGFESTSRELAASLLEFQGEEGELLSQPGQLDGTGQAMWALEEAHGRGAHATPPDSLVRAVTRAWRWCESRRALVRERAPHFAGLMPPADPRDNELAAGYLFGTDAWTLAGYRAGAALLERAGERIVADSMRRSASDYAELVNQRLSTRESGVPARWAGPARDWGNYAAHFPTGAISADVADRAKLIGAIDHAGPGAGLAHYGTTDTLHLYVGLDLAMDALLLERPELWRAALAATLAACTGTGGLPEIYSASTRSFGGNLPPHATSAAALLVLVRQGLVFDALGDTLRLTLGTLPSWWDAGGSIEHAATRWGAVDLAFRREGERVTWKWTPVPVWTALTLPPGAHRVSGTGDDLPGSATRVLVPPGRGEVEIQCHVD